MNDRRSYFLIITSFMVGLGAISPHTYAQISPDGSLSTSVTSPDGQNFVIENGDRTGNNLFHSFSEFSIPTNGSAVFNNPTDIENIFSRVTGPSRSNIDGLLQTTGTTNLFLLNPNGIIFGPNAQLDVAGSFMASTADSFTFADGAEFSTTVAEPPLLSISVPVGLQLNQPQGNIESRGQLETGQDLTLLGQSLYLEGTVTTGQNLILQAQDTVTLRDTSTVPFVTRSGADLTIQGNQGIDILTLQHPERPPFVSGGNLTLISDGDISADAHFQSGGDLRFLSLAGAPGSIVSLYDPIILADGDVLLGDYTGVALKVVAQGSIDAGDIVITGPDTTLNADGSGSDVDLLASSRAAILRAGVNAARGLPPGCITVSSINTTDMTGGDGGPIILEAVGDITTTGAPFSDPLGFDVGLGSFSFSGTGDSGNGGPITITSDSGNINILSGDLNSQSFSDPGDSSAGGDIILTSNTGDITIENVDSSSIALPLPLGLDAPSGNSGDGGNITLSTGSGNIRAGGSLAASSDSSASGAFSGNTGNGGTITLSSTTGDIFTEGFFIQSASTTQSVEDLQSATTASGNSGNGGNIIVSSTSGNITTNSVILSFSLSRARSSVSASAGTSGDGGNISITSESGTITVNPPLLASDEPDLIPFVRSLSESSATLVASMDVDPDSATASASDSGNGGDILINSNSGDIVINAGMISTSFSVVEADTNQIQSVSDAAGAGAINVSTQSGNIQTRDLLSLSFSNTGTAGRGGEISLSSLEESLIGNNRSLSVVSIGEQPEATGAGGSVTLRANQAISDLEILTFANTGPSGKVNIQGLGDNLTVSDVELFVALQDSVSSLIDNEFPVDITLDTETTFTSGQASIESLGDLTLNNVAIEASANSTEPSGNVFLTSPGQVTVLNSQINSNANNTGRAGSIEVTAESLALTNTTLSATTTGPGGAGDIRLNLSDTLSLDDSTLTSSTDPGSTGQGGNIEVNATAPNLETRLQNESQLAVNSEGQGQGGNINLTGQRLTLKDASQINATTSSSDGGNVSLVLGDLLLLRNGSEISTTAGSARAGGDGGDISVTLANGFIVALPAENSDITANAFEGDGGNIQITASGIVGLQFRPELTPLSDITASSEFGVDGVVQLDIPDLEPSQGVIELPVALVDPTNQIATGCLAAADNSFTVSGRGSLPDSPDSPNSLAIWEDWRPLETEVRSATPSKPVESLPLMEATEVLVAADGHVEFVAQSEPLRSSHQMSCESRSQSREK